MINQEIPNNVIEFIPRKAAMVSLERLKGVTGPERRLVGQDAQRPQPDTAEDLREGSGVEPAAIAKPCPVCKGTGLHRTVMRRIVTEISCPMCRGRDERSGRLNAEASHGSK